MGSAKVEFEPIGKKRRLHAVIAIKEWGTKMNWKCPECGNEDNTEESIRCSCGNEVPDNTKYLVPAKDYTAQHIPITKRRLAVSSILITIACLLQLWDGTFGKLSGGLIGLASIIMMSKEGMTRPLNSKDAIALGAFILLTIGMILWFPKSWDAVLGKWLSTPTVVFTFWIIMLLIVYRRWKLSQRYRTPAGHSWFVDQ